MTERRALIAGLLSQQRPGPVRAREGDGWVKLAFSSLLYFSISPFRTWKFSYSMLMAPTHFYISTVRVRALWSKCCQNHDEYEVEKTN